MNRKNRKGDFIGVSGGVVVLIGFKVLFETSKRQKATLRKVNLFRHKLDHNYTENAACASHFHPLTLSVPSGHGHHLDNSRRLCWKTTGGRNILVRPPSLTGLTY